MALNSLGLGFVFTARDLASGQIRQLGTRFGQFDRSSDRAMRRYNRNIRILGAGLGMLAASGAAAAGAFALANASGRFEQGLARVGGITRATTAELEQLRETAIRTGIETSFSPDQAIEGLTNLATLGFTAAESMRLLDPAAALAEGGLISVDSATRTVGAATRVFGLSMDEAAGSADRLLRITQLTALQANDLELALGTVARGAGQTSQNMNEMLVAMGLVRNTGVETSVAASSVSSALQFMAKNARQIEQELGVAVVDEATGQFRNYLDIVLEASSALEERFPNAADRASTSLDLFGRFGVTSFNAVQQQLANGIRTSTGELVRGAEAIAYLRGQMRDSTGTAEEFRRRLLDTLPGQLTLLRGSLQTLAVTMGENFARAFRPLIEGILGFINALIAKWNAIPSEVRDGIAGVIVAMTGFVGALGSFLTVSAAIALIAPFLKAIALAAGGLLVAMAPLIAAFAVLVGAVKTFSFAMRYDIGGIATWIRGVVDRIRLVWNGLVSLFTQGGFSSELAGEMNRAENRGIRNFVVMVFQLGYRLQRLWDGIVAGFSGTMLAMGPTIEALGGAFREFANALGITLPRARDMGDALPSDSFVRFGQTVGHALATVIRMVLEGVTFILRFSTSVWMHMQVMIKRLQPSWNLLTTMTSVLGRTFNRLTAAISGSSSESSGAGSTWATLAHVIGFVVVAGINAAALAISGIMFLLTGLIGLITGAINAFKSLMNIAGTVADALPEPAGDFLRSLPGIGSFIGEAETPAATPTRGGAARSAASERLSLPSVVAGEAQARTERRQIAIQQSIADNQTASTGVFRGVLNIDGRRLQEFQAQLERTDRAARGGPVPGDS